MKTKFFLLVYTLMLNVCLAYNYELCICAIFRDEAPYLREWIEFHKLVGVEHFYLANHNSKDNYKEILQPYIKSGLVELFEIPTGSEGEDYVYFVGTIQVNYYTDIINLSKGVSKWVAFLDTDEFLFPVEKFSLLDFLKDYEECAGIGVNWQMFGTSNVDKVKTNELLIEKLTRCAVLDHPFNTHIKSIVKPECVFNVTNPHFVNYLPGYSQVDPEKNPFFGIFLNNNYYKKIRINHYWLRDEYFFKNSKIPRRLKWGHPINDLMKQHKELNEIHDNTIHKYVSKLKFKLRILDKINHANLRFRNLMRERNA